MESMRDPQKEKWYEYKRKKLKHRHWVKESKSNRNMWHRKYRRSVSEKMVHQDYDNIPEYQNTCGWLTW